MKRIVFFFSLLCIVSSQYSQQYTIEQYLNIRGAGSPQYSFDDSRIYFTQSVTGTSQVWMVEKPMEWPVQVTFFNERISSYSVNPKNDLILAESDIGGSEYGQFFLMDGQGNSTKRITDAKPKVLYGFGRWNTDGKWFTYFSNERSPYFYDVFTYNVETGKSEQVFSSDHSNYPSVISPDGRMMVITRSYKTDDNDLYLINLETKESKLITLHDNIKEPCEFFAVSFSSSGDNIFIRSNYGSDYYRLMKYDIKKGNLEPAGIKVLEQFGNYDLNSAFFSVDKSKAVFIINVEGYDKMLVYDLNANREIIIPPQLKSSSITSVSFSNSGDKILVGINSAANPSVIYEWSLSSNAVLQVTKPTLAGINPESFVEPELIKYKSFDGMEIPAFIYLPKNTVQGEKIPCIINLHGGPEGQSTYGFAAVFQYFLNAGYAIIDPNVRGSTGYGKKYAALDNIKNRENSVKDAAFLVEYIKSRGDIDPGKIAVYGGSYGGYMVLACMTLYPELFAAGIDVVGISNFISFLQNTADYRRKNRESEYGSLENDYEFLKSISPLNKADKIKSPLMIIHGKNDPRVPVGEAQQMYDAVISNGGIAELLIYDDEGHGISKLKNRLDAYPKIVSFLDKYVKNRK